MSENTQNKKKTWIIWGVLGVLGIAFITSGFEIGESSICPDGSIAVTINNQWVCVDHLNSTQNASNEICPIGFYAYGRYQNGSRK